MKHSSLSLQGCRQPGRLVLLGWLVLTTLVSFTQTAFTYQEPGKQSSEALKDDKLTQTLFTYQGQLKENGVPANGVYTFQFGLYTGQSEGHRLGLVIKDAVVVKNGSFTMQLDFGSDGFSRNECWLEVGVRLSNSTDAYTALSPRQRLTSTPYAILAQAEPWSLIAVPVGFRPGVGADIVTGEKIADNAVTSAKIAEQQVVKSINSMKDDVTLTAGDNVTITPNGNTLTIATTGAQGGGDWITDKGVVRLTTEENSVGIGINEPTAKLDVNGSIRARGAIRSGNSMTFNGLDHTITATDVVGQLFSKQIRIGFSNTPAPDPITFPDIKVGIGTLTPGATLHVDQPNVPNAGEAARITFQNLTDTETAFGVNAVESAVKSNRGGHIGVNAQTSINATQGPQQGGALGRLAQASGFFAGGTILGVFGQSTPGVLTNFDNTTTSFGVGGLFRGGPASGTLNLDGTGTYWVGGVHGQVSGAINNSPGAGAVAGVIGIDTNTGTAVSYAGFFGGRVRVTNLTGGPNNSLVTAETNGTLHSIAIPNDANQVLLGDGTFGSVPGSSANAWLLTGNTLTGSEFLGSTNAFPLKFFTNNAERVRVSTTGEVGIGTTSPTATLHINGTTRFAGVATLDSGVHLRAAINGGARILGEQGNTAARPAIGFFSTNGVDDGGGGNGIFRPLANTMAFATTSTEHMRITSGGAVGIGTMSPTENLDVAGRVRVRTLNSGSPSDDLVVADSSGVLRKVPQSSIGVGNAWLLTGNAAVPGNFLGTTVNVPLEVRVNNSRALLIEDNFKAPNMIGGSPANSVIAGVGGATIGGGGFAGQAGNGNTVTGDFGTVSGGRKNEAGNLGAVAGGFVNIASGVNSAVGGGGSNTASGPSATVPGGSVNTAAGNVSFAAGCQAQALHNGAFVWADVAGCGTPFPSTKADQFNIRASGGTRIFSNTAATVGVTLASGSNAWSVMSDRNMKENFVPLDGRLILHKLSLIPITQWNLKSQSTSIKHFGPMAQDFYASFGLGESNRHISTSDADGVAFASIQALYQISVEKDKQIQDLQQRIEKLEKLVGAMIKKQ